MSKVKISMKRKISLTQIKVECEQCAIASISRIERKQEFRRFIVSNACTQIVARDQCAQFIYVCLSAISVHVICSNHV